MGRYLTINLSIYNISRMSEICSTFTLGFADGVPGGTAPPGIVTAAKQTKIYSNCPTDRVPRLPHQHFI